MSRFGCYGWYWYLWKVSWIRKLSFEILCWKISNFKLFKKGSWYIYFFIYWPDWALVPLVQRPKVVAFANFIRLVIFLLTAFWLSEPSVVVCLIRGSGPKEDGSVKFGLEHQPDLRGRSSEAVVVWRLTPARRDDVGENCSGRSNGFKLKFLCQVSFLIVFRCSFFSLLIKIGYNLLSKCISDTILGARYWGSD